MFDGGISLKSEDRVGARTRRLILGDEDVWVLVARQAEDVAGLLREGLDENGDAALWICRAVLEEGVVVIRAGEQVDPLPSDLVGHEEGEWA